MTLPIQHRAAAATAAIDAAKTPLQKHEARADGLAVKAGLEKQIADENFKAAFKAAKPQSVVGMWKGEPRFFFMVRSDGSKPTSAVELPDGSKVMPIQGQIPVPENQFAAMVARGWKRSANSAITDLGGALGLTNPARPNNV